MVQIQSLEDGRRMSRNVLAVLAAAWGTIWEDAAAMQADNPRLLEWADRSPSDPEEAIRALLPVFAYVHPQVVAAAAAFCRAVADEFAAVDDETVSPPRDTDERVFVAVEGGRMTKTGGQQPHDQLAQLEAENENLRARVAQLLRQQESDRTTMGAALTILADRLDAID